MNSTCVEAGTLGVVILAAGQSSRMGRPKLLLPWGETSVLGHQIRVWQQLGAGQIAVVCSSTERTLFEELDRLRFPEDARIGNPEPARGMFSSIRCAAEWPGWRSGLERVAIVLGDQPQVRIETLRTLLVFSAARPSQACQPRAGGRLRHPVILPWPMFATLRQSSAASLKEFLQTAAGEIAACDSADAGLEFDLDTPADYARGLALGFPAR